MNYRLAGLAGWVITAAALQSAETPAPKDTKEKVSYSIGVNVGTSFKRQGLEITPEVFLNGVKDALAGGKLALTEAEMEGVLEAFQKDMQTKQMERAKVLSETNKKEGEKFQTENKKKDGVKTTASGLQYKVLTAGTGKKPAATDMVRVHYKGTLLDGTEFDSSYKRNEPAEFPVAGLIPAWTEALQLMPVGSKWQLVAPASIAYGEDGQGPVIGPNATLVFEVELLAIVSQTKADK